MAFTTHLVTTQAKIKSGEIAISAGQIFYTSDSKRMFVDIDDSTRIEISDIIELETEEDRVELEQPENKFYYVASTGVLWRCQDDAWQVIGADSTIMSADEPENQNDGDTWLEELSLDEDYEIPDEGMTIGDLVNLVNGKADAANLPVEEGTWTPRLENVSGVTFGTYSQCAGWYSRTGKHVEISFVIQLSSVTGGAGQIVIRGIPFVCNHTVAGSLTWTNLLLQTSDIQVVPTITTGDMSIELMVLRTSGSWYSSTNVIFQTNSAIRGTVIYTTE